MLRTNALWDHLLVCDHAGDPLVMGFTREVICELRRKDRADGRHAQGTQELVVITEPMSEAVSASVHR